MSGSPDSRGAADTPGSSRKRAWILAVAAGLVLLHLVVLAPIADAAAARFTVVRGLESAQNGSDDAGRWILRPDTRTDERHRSYMINTALALDGMAWRVGAVEVDGDAAWAVVLVERPGSSNGPEARLVSLYRLGGGYLGWQVLGDGEDSVFSESAPIE